MMMIRNYRRTVFLFHGEAVLVQSQNSPLSECLLMMTRCNTNNCLDITILITHVPSLGSQDLKSFKFITLLETVSCRKQVFGSIFFSGLFFVASRLGIGLRTKRKHKENDVLYLTAVFCYSNWTISAIHSLLQRVVLKFERSDLPEAA